jgi:hypothetical protein
MFLDRIKSAFCLLVIACFISGCWSGFSSPVVPPSSEASPRLVAVLPVDNETSDTQAAQILRKKIFEELYFKGYPKIPLEFVDGKLSKVYKKNAEGVVGKIPPKAIGELLGVDAVMYCTLTEWKTSFVYFYASTAVSASFELRSAKTGETLWSSHYRVVKKSYGFSNKELEMKSCQVYERAVEEVVNKAMETLPDGPDTV